MQMRSLTTLSVVLACGTLASMASAVDTVRATFNSVSPNTSCEFSNDFGGTWKGTLAGGMNWTRDNVNPGTFAGLQGDFRTFCIEITQNVGFGNTYDYLVIDPSDAPTFDPMGSFRAGQLSELFGRFYSGLTTGSDYGAFQMAVWEIVYEIGETPLNVDNGRFQIRNAAPEQAMANAIWARWTARARR
ncbi:MAG: hypothetical protein K2Y21_08045 [Phycisphaerales bacterium]|nr:hypothetical protein [Phycisphaerales bacterium]